MSSRGLSIFGFGKSPLATFGLRGRNSGIWFDLFVSHQCYESDRMYEQRGFTPPSLPLPYTRGCLTFNWHAISSPCSDLVLLPRHGALLPYPSREEECCDLRPRALVPDSDTPHGLPLWARTHNARRCMHACMARGGRDTMEERQDAAGKAMWYVWLLYGLRGVSGG